MSTPQRDYSTVDFSSPTKVCDIVLKGGITSGVVYPLAIVRLAQRYRFSSVGGTSAGAIGAALTAAAEHGRHAPGGGFARLAGLPAYLGKNLLGLFQPAPALRTPFRMFLAALSEEALPFRLLAMASAAACGHYLATFLGALPGLVLALWAGCAGETGWLALGLVLAVLGSVLLVAWRLASSVLSELPKHRYGVCPGIRQPGYAGDAFTDWLAQEIDATAGLQAGAGPLTFGHLDHPPAGAPPIRLAMMTTNLMMRRPYRLPLRDRLYAFRAADFDQLFPAAVVQYLRQNCRPWGKPQPGCEPEYYHFPDAEKLPVIVAVRMSLSFPGLISAVPLYICDRTLNTREKRQQLQPCLFSDGGLSSNFPIHFFDRLWPSAPTFAIALDSHDPDRARSDQRAWMPKSAGSGVRLPVEPIQGLGGFLMRLVDTAKDWQDHLQSTLPGYRERIAHVTLNDKEGGLNLTMRQETIDAVSGYGAQAADLLGEFSLDMHRWRRFLVAMARVEQTVDEMAKSWETSVEGESFAQFIERYAYTKPKSYEQPSRAHTEELLKRAATLAELGKAWRQSPTIRSGKIPQPDTDLRITPKP